MKHLRKVLLAAIILTLMAPPFLVTGADEGWEDVVPGYETGIEYRKFYLSDPPNQVYVTRMDRSNPRVTIESSIGQGRISGGFETVSSQARRYDDAINFWGGEWGNRNRVIAAINGAMNSEDPKYPDRGIFNSGWYAKRYTDQQNGSGFAWKFDRTAFIGGCVKHPLDKQFITYEDGTIQEFSGVNTPREDEELIIYTPQWDATTLTDDSGVEVLVEMVVPAQVQSPPVQGIVREVRRNQGNNLIPFDHIILSANGKAGDKLRNHALEGTTVKITHTINHFELDCKTANPDSWSGVFAAVGADRVILRAGQVVWMDPLKEVKNPRTVIAFNAQYVFFIVVDGRNPGISTGMTRPEVAAFAKDVLGATDAINQDGGGSSALVVNGRVMNSPSDALALPSSAPTPAPTPRKSVQNGKEIYMPLVSRRDPSAPPQEGIVERAVPNGMMMVLVLPKTQSKSYIDGQEVIVLEDTRLRLGPGTNYGALATIPTGSFGVIQANPAGLNGVFAKGTSWWKVQFSLGEEILTGWADETDLTPVQAP